MVEGDGKITRRRGPVKGASLPDPPHEREGGAGWLRGGKITRRSGPVKVAPLPNPPREGEGGAGWFWIGDGV